MTDDPKLSYKYGTRHRAAIGLSEIYDGLCIVVSEETGSISAANRGMLVRYSEASELADPLSYLYHQNRVPTTSAPGPLGSFLTLFARAKRDDRSVVTAEPEVPTADQANAPRSVQTPILMTDEPAIAPPAGEPDPRLSGDLTSIASLAPHEPEQVL
jgi:hypothetical protein